MDAKLGLLLKRYSTSFALVNEASDALVYGYLSAKSSESDAQPGNLNLSIPHICLSIECSPVNMKILLYTVVFYYLKDSASAELVLEARCPTRCDVSTCPSPSCPSGYVPDRCNCCLVCAQGEGEPCGHKDDLRCGDGLECKYTAGKPLSKGVCQCRFSYEVCGTDGKTYGNVCQLKATSRKSQQQGLPGVGQIQKGPCLTTTGTTYAVIN